MRAALISLRRRLARLARRTPERFDGYEFCWTEAEADGPGEDDEGEVMDDDTRRGPGEMTQADPAECPSLREIVALWSY